MQSVFTAFKTTLAALTVAWLVQGGAAQAATVVPVLTGDFSVGLPADLDAGVDLMATLDGANTNDLVSLLPMSLYVFAFGDIANVVADLTIIDNANQIFLFGQLSSWEVSGSAIVAYFDAIDGTGLADFASGVRVTLFDTVTGQDALTGRIEVSGIESAVIPLPAALPLMLAGLGGLGLVSLRRRRA